MQWHSSLNSTLSEMKALSGQHMKRRRVLIIGSIIFFCVVTVIGVWPYTNPWLICAKIRILGSVLVYGPLAYDDDRWEIVLAGVRSGTPIWLRVAVDIYPALDTHPGEEMLGAVSSVIDKNTVGAIDILVPTYGANIVCGEQEEGEPINKVVAEKRILLLATAESHVKKSASLEACRRVILDSAQ